MPPTPGRGSAPISISHCSKSIQNNQRFHSENHQSNKNRGGSTVLLLIGPKRCHWISKRRIQLCSNAGFRSAGRLDKGTQDIGHPSSSVVRARNHQHTQQVQVGVHFFQGQQPHICSFLPPHKHCSSFTPCLCGHALTQNCVVTFLTLNFNHPKTVFCFLFKLHRLDISGLVSGNSNAGNSTREYDNSQQGKETSFAGRGTQPFL